jgi:hypothetical protein
MWVFFNGNTGSEKERMFCLLIYVSFMADEADTCEKLSLSTVLSCHCHIATATCCYHFATHQMPLPITTATLPLTNLPPCQNCHCHPSTATLPLPKLPLPPCHCHPSTIKIATHPLSNLPLPLSKLPLPPIHCHPSTATATVKTATATQHSANPRVRPK